MDRVRILYLINDLFVNNFEYMYHLIKKMDLFDITILSCDSNKTNYKHRTSSDEICRYIQSNQIKCIDAYDYEKDEWIDLEIFNPDYIFVSNPYDIYRPEKYNSLYLSGIAKLCTIEYGAIIIKDKDSFVSKNAFYSYCSYVFVADHDELSFFTGEDQSVLSKFIPSGCTKTDKYLFENNREKTKEWETLFGYESECARIVWKPRWAIQDIDGFLDDVAKMAEYGRHNGKQILLLEHPLLVSKIESFGMEYLNKFGLILQENNTSIRLYNKPQYLDVALQADALVGENTSLMSEFTITGRPIFYIGKYGDLNEYGKKIIDQRNVFECYDTDLFDALDQIEHSSKTDFANRKFFMSPDGISSSEYILRFLAKDHDSDKEYFKRRYHEATVELNKIRKILMLGHYEELMNIKIPYSAEIDLGLKNWQKEIDRLRKASSTKEIMKKSINKLFGKNDNTKKENNVK